jgi:hypothetical protein
MKAMFRVTFRNVENDRDLTQTLLLPVVPDKGERVHIRQEPDGWRVQEGVVTERVWYICATDANASDVVVLVALNQKRR